MLELKLVTDESTLQTLADSATLVAAVAAAIIAPAVSVWLARKQIAHSHELARDQTAENARAADAQARANESALDRQIRATVVSTNRQKWIDALRDDVAEVISTNEATQRLVIKSAYQILTDGEEAEANRLSDHRRMLINRVRLRLNPDETDHQELLASLQSLQELQVDDLDEGYERVVQITQTILKDEWKRVKSGE